MNVTVTEQMIKITAPADMDVEEYQQELALRWVPNERCELVEIEEDDENVVITLRRVPISTVQGL